eukprot:7138625-Pyramimonas_sp.AAC.1
MSRGARQPAVGFVPAGQPAAMQMGPAAPSSRYVMGEAAFGRQRRARPTAAPPIINDDDFTTCDLSRGV